MQSSIILSDVSDHLPVATLVDLVFRAPKIPKYIFKRQHASDAIDQFKLSLNSVDWKDVTNLCASDNPDAAYNSFIHTYFMLYDNYFPVRKIRCDTKNYPKQPWITKALIKSCNAISKLYKTYICNPTSKNENTYITYRNKLKSLLRRAEKDHYAATLFSCQYNLNKTWKIIKNLINKPKTDCIHDKVVSGDVNVANAFNEYFVNIGSELAHKIPSCNVDFKKYFVRSFSNSFAMFYADVNEVISVCSTLNQKKSVGYDNISSDIAIKSISNI